MLYVTETGDEKQSFRDRLFIRWFNTYEHHDLYYIQTAEGRGCKRLLKNLKTRFHLFLTDVYLLG